MPKYLIERDVPGLGQFSERDLQALALKSVRVLHGLGPEIQWLHSYVSDDKLCCVYIAPDEALIREHAEQGGFPCNRINEVKTMIDPTTAEPVAEPAATAAAGATATTARAVA